jgi:hypothetical protein
MFDFDAAATGAQLSSVEIRDTSSMPYSQVRSLCIKSYAKVFRDELAFDLNCVPKAVRLRLIDDPVYKTQTKALKAKMYAEQISTLSCIASSGMTSDDGRDNSKTVLSAIQSQNNLVFSDLNDADEDSKINIEFIAMTEADFASDPLTEIHEGTSNGNLSGGEETGAEEALKEKAKKIAEKEREEAGNVGDC